MSKLPTSIVSIVLALSGLQVQALDRADLPALPTIVVDGTTCNLADAIRAANDGATVGGCAGTAGLDLLSLEADITLSSADTVHSTLVGGAHAGLPDVTSPLVLIAGAGSLVERDPALPCGPEEASQFRLFNVAASGALYLLDMTLRGGCVAPGSGITAEGGAIHVEAGLVELDGSTLEGHGVHGTSAGEGAHGGALFCRGGSVPSIFETTFRNNRVQGTDDELLGTPSRGGAARFDDCVLGSIEESLFDTNSAIGSSNADNSGQGGALHVDASTVDRIAGTTFTDNVALGGSDSTLNSSSAGQGGALYFRSSTMSSISGSVFRANRAEAGDSTLASGNRGQGGSIYMSSADVGGIGGSVFELNVAQAGDSALDGSPGDADGGALYVSGSSSVERIHDSLFRGNAVLGGAVVGPSDGRTTIASGGALQIDGGDFLLIERVTFEDNLAQGGTASNAFGRGGALNMGFNGTSARIVQCNFDGNRAVGGTDVDPSDPGGTGSGGALFLEGAIELVANTFTRNAAQGGSGPMGSGEGRGGAIWIDDDAVMATANLLSGNLSLEDNGAATPDDCGDDDVHLTSGGFNLVEATGNCSFAATGDQTGVATAVHALADWGCQTTLPDGTCVPTLAIDQSSPATDAGSCTTAVIADDSREVPRPFDLPALADVDDGCDIGAFEAIDTDGDGFTEATDCAPEDPGVHALDPCGVCGGDASTCSIFIDGFESGDTSAW